MGSRTGFRVVVCCLLLTATAEISGIAQTSRPEQPDGSVSADLAAFLAGQNLAIPQQLSCSSRSAPRDLILCLYRSDYPTPVKDPVVHMTITRIAVAALMHMHPNPQQDFEYYIFVMRLALNGTNTCGHADELIEAFWESIGGDQRSLDLLRRGDLKNVYRAFATGPCCVDSRAMCFVMREHGYDRKPDLVEQVVSISQPQPGGVR